MNQDHSEIIIVLDRSGSMASIKKDMEGEGKSDDARRFSESEVIGALRAKVKLLTRERDEARAVVQKSIDVKAAIERVKAVFSAKEAYGTEEARVYFQGPRVSTNLWPSEDDDGTK
jgi:hypothetical protein